jgi:nicotinamidase-related amidase
MTELLDIRRSLVLIIDMQGKLMEMIHRPSLVIESTCRLLRFAELYQVPVLLTEQYPQGLGPTHRDVRTVYDGLQTERRYLDKTAFGCCADERFEEALQQLRPDVPVGRRQVVVAGIEAHVCVMQTVIELLRAGNQVHLCWECVSGRGEEYRRHALERMQQAGAVMTNHESVGFEWARDTSHPGFKALSAILKKGQPT